MCVILVSLNNDNMVNYTFTTDQGWRVTEYRPFSASYAVLHSPCMPGTYERRPMSETGQTRSDGYSLPLRATENHSNDHVHPIDNPSGNMLQQLTSQQLTFNYFSADVLRQLLAERVAIRDRNRSSILGRLSDVSGDIYGASVLRTPEADKQRQSLEKTRMDLERQLREEDVTLWRDCLEARRELILADKTFSGTQFRQGLMRNIPYLYDNKGQDDTALSE